MHRTERDQHAFTRCQRGFPSEPQSGCLLRLATNKKETSRRTDSAQSLNSFPWEVLGTTLLQWSVAACMRAATCALAWGVAGVQDHKANTSLTLLSLGYDEVGDAGATALAEAVKVTVLTCKKCVFRESVCCQSKCASQSRLKNWRRHLVLQCALQLLLFSFFLKGNLACCGVLFASCSQVDVAQFQNRIGLSESSTSLRQWHLLDCGAPPHHVIRAYGRALRTTTVM